MMATDEFKFEKLTAENYHTWGFSMKMYLIGKELWDIVTSAETLSDEATTDQKKQFKKCENDSLTTISLSISTSLEIYVRSATTGKEAWDKLEKHFQQKTLSRKIFLRRKLYSAKLEKVGDMANQVNETKAISEHLETIGDPVVEHDLVLILISSLPEKFNYLIIALETIAESTLTWDYVRDRLIQEADKLQKSNGNEINDALFTNNRTERSNKIKFHYCKKKGHIARDCYKKKHDDAEKQKDNLANQYKENEYNITLPEIALKLSCDIHKSDWWIFSGASQHMTYEKSNFLKWNIFKLKELIMMKHFLQLHDIIPYVRY